MTLPLQIRLTKAKIGLITHHPFFAALVMRLELVEDAARSGGIMATDGVHIFYNPDAVTSLSDDEITAVLAHEAMHPALQYWSRLGSRDPLLWNAAQDYSINHMLKESGFKLPKEALMNDKYGVMAADEVYQMLLTKQIQLPKCGKGKKDKKDKDEKGDGKGSPGDQPGDEEGDNPWNVGGTISEESDDPNKNSSGKTQTQLSQEWKEAFAQAVQAGKMAGKLPAGMERLLDDILKPVQKWKDLLRAYLLDRRVTDPQWNRPNRRMVGHDIYIPSRSWEETGELVIAIDTSGSIGTKELNEFGAELNDIVKELRPEKITIVWADAAVAGTQEFSWEDEIVLIPKGGGGTDFRPAFDWVEENEVAPHAFVYMTDGYGCFPDRPTDYPTVWLMNNDQVIPPWGIHLVMDLDS